MANNLPNVIPDYVVILFLVYLFSRRTRRTPKKYGLCHLNLLNGLIALCDGQDLYILRDERS